MDLRSLIRLPRIFYHESTYSVLALISKHISSELTFRALCILMTRCSLLVNETQFLSFVVTPASLAFGCTIGVPLFQDNEAALIEFVLRSSYCPVASFFILLVTDIDGAFTEPTIIVFFVG
ncbi:unnamed protein product [Dicrocoelium dendriticum]|nr:unnamed protein product [Dicrocoelium dendriticum]